MKKVNRRRMNDESGHNIWRSYSDMMSGLLLLFVLIMAVCLMQAQKNYNDRLAEQATRLRTQDELEQTQNELTQRESEIEAQSMTLTDLQTALEAQAAQLKSQQEELETAQAKLAEQESELLSRNESLAALDADLAARDAELAARDEQLASSQKLLDEQTQLMSEQQKKIDQIIGVKADLIESLSSEFRSNNIESTIDPSTGAIVLKSSVLFDYNESDLKEEGTELLSQVLPTYCSVLLSPQYVDYVAEVIVDGYTDSTGGYNANLQLSQDRARAVSEYLLEISSAFLSEEQYKELSEKLTTNGKSSSNLILDENNQEDRDASRRVEIKFRLKDEEMIQEMSDLISKNAEELGETTVSSGG